MRDHGHTLGQADADKLFRRVHVFLGDFGFEVECVTHQPLAAGRQIENTRVAGVDIVVENGDRPLHQVQVIGVGEFQRVERVPLVAGRGVDRKLFGADVGIDDWQGNSPCCADSAGAFGYRLNDVR